MKSRNYWSVKKYTNDSGRRSKSDMHCTNLRYVFYLLIHI